MLVKSSKGLTMLGTLPLILAGSRKGNDAREVFGKVAKRKNHQRFNNTYENKTNKP